MCHCWEGGNVCYPSYVPLCVCVWACSAAHSKMDSQEEHGGATHQGSREPGLLPAHNAIPSQDHLTPALQLLLQLGRFLSLNTKSQTLPTVLQTQHFYNVSTIWELRGISPKNALSHIHSRQSAVHSPDKETNAFTLHTFPLLHKLYQTVWISYYIINAFL